MPHWGCRYRWEDNMKMDMRKLIGFGYLRIDTSECGKDPWVPKSARNFLII
jgi:hypothetical protein